MGDKVKRFFEAVFVSSTKPDLALEARYMLKSLQENFSDSDISIIAFQFILQLEQSRETSLKQARKMLDEQEDVKSSFSKLVKIEKE